MADEHPVIESVDVSDLQCPPAAGDKAGDCCMFSYDDTHLHLDGCGWYDETNSCFMNTNDEFVSGNLYSFKIIFSAQGDYVFDDTTVITINGGTDLVDFGRTSFSDTEMILYTIPVEAHDELIENVDIIGLQFPPVPGEKAGATCAFSFVDNSHFSVNFCSWHDDTDGNWMQDDDVFTEGHLYSFDIDLNADHGYIFDEEKTHVTINGSTEIIDFIYTTLEGGVLSIWTVSAEPTDTLPYVLIESISIRDVDTTPIAGDSADMHINYSWPADGHYTVAEVFWFNYDSNEQLEPTDVFEAGVRYQIVFRIVPNEGYRFAPYAVITINGGEVDGESGVREDGAYAMAGSLCEEAKVPGSDILIGDVNRDGKVNTADAVFVLKYSAGMISFDNDQLIAANTNKDDKVNTADAVFVLKYAAGMITEF